MRSILILFFGVIMAASTDLFANITLIVDPKVLAIPLADNHEPLVNIKETHTLAYGPSPEIPNNTDYTWMRKNVYDKLVAADRQLPKGYHICLYEAYRSIGLQKKLFDEQRAHVVKRNPTWSNEQIFNETIKLVSPVINQDGSSNTPPHSTGGAIDVYLIDDTGTPYDMGIHPKDWMQDADGLLSLTDSPHISEAAKKNRAILSGVLSAVGFVNYPTEYWHWSYGDRYWAFVEHQPKTIYSSYVL